jgi:hypothetical protein
MSDVYRNYSDCGYDPDERFRFVNAATMKRDILAALRAELPTFSCYEPSRLIGTPCSCVVGMARAIEIVEGVA